MRRGIGQRPVVFGVGEEEPFAQRPRVGRGPDFGLEAVDVVILRHLSASLFGSAWRP